MLYIGEKVGAEFPDGTEVPEVDIAVDPLEGTNLCATGAPGAITVLAASESGGLLNAPDCYMEKIVVGPSCKGAVDIDAPVIDNLKNIAKRMHRDVEDLVIIVLDRPRHEKLITEIRKAGARIRLIGDGDLSAGIAAAVIGTGVHAVMGSGGAPGRRDYRGRHPLPERLHAGPPGDRQAGTRRAHRAHGHQGQKQDLRGRGPCPGQAAYFRRHRSHRRVVAEGSALLRRRHANHPRSS